MARGTPLHPTTTVLGEAIRARRSGVSQEDSADEAMVPRGTLSRIERGVSKPSAETARALARWLGWTIEEVLDAAEAPNP